MGVDPSCPICLIAAASLVAVETDVGVTISITKVAFVCGLWSYFCIHHLFPCLEVLVQSASPHHAVGCKVLRGLGVDVKCFHVSLADILVAQLWAAFGSPSLKILPSDLVRRQILSDAVPKACLKSRAKKIPKSVEARTHQCLTLLLMSKGLEELPLNCTAPFVFV